MSGEEASTVRADGVDAGDRLRLRGGIICLAKQSVYLLPITLINARHIAIQHHHWRFCYLLYRGLKLNAVENLFHKLQLFLEGPKLLRRILGWPQNFRIH